MNGGGLRKHLKGIVLRTGEAILNVLGNHLRTYIYKQKETSVQHTQ